MDINRHKPSQDSSEIVIIRLFSFAIFLCFGLIIGEIAKHLHPSYGLFIIGYLLGGLFGFIIDIIFNSFK